MALNSGFPPSGLISPSVRISEIDRSFLTSTQSGHRAGVVGFASKGPINSPTLITNQRHLHTVFGFAHPDTSDPYLIYTAEQYLNYGNELYVVRAAAIEPTDSEAATVAEIDVLAAGTPVAIISNTAGSYVFAEDRYFKWKLNGILASKTLVVLAGTYTVDQLVATLNDDLSDVDGIEFYKSSTFIAVRTTFSYGTESSIEFVSIASALYGPRWNGSAFAAPVTGLGTNMTQAIITGTVEKYPSSETAGTFDFSALTSANLKIVISGSENAQIDNVVQVVDLPLAENSTQDIVDAINDAITNADIPGGFVATKTGNYVRLQTLHTGADAKILVKSSSTVNTYLGLDSTTVHSGTTPSGVTGSANYTAGIVSGGANLSSDVCFTLKADSEGIDGNATVVEIINSVVNGNFSMKVSTYGSLVESWGNLTKNVDDRYYVESYMALASDYIRVLDNTNVTALPANGTYTLVGGTDGIPSDPDDQDAILIGSSVSMTGLQALSDPEQVDIDVVCVPGHPSTANIVALLEFCESRQDCFAIIDPPFGLTVKEVIHWQNGTHPLNDTRFNSNFGAMYWPWVEVRDTFNRINVWVPPSTAVLAAYARSDNLSHPWIAPAGIERGFLPNVNDAFSRPTLQERDDMYGDRNAVNPIIYQPDEGGFYIWGQKTLQRRPSKLDRVNVRRMMLYAEKQIKRNSKALQFEPNDPQTWARFKTMATTVLQTIKSGRGILDFKIQCDADINTPDVVDRNELRAKIGVIPTSAAEFIFIEFSVFSNRGFDETSDI